MPFVQTRDGTRLHYTDWGTGQPVVFIHGWALGADMWEYQLPYLASRGLRCIAYDKRGCGRSDQPWGGYDFDTFADDLGALLDHLDLREATLVAHSMGGGDLARYLARHGAGRVARAVLVGTTTPFLLQTADNPDGVNHCVYDDMVAALSADRPRYLASLAPGFFGAGLPNVAVSPEIVQWGVGLALRASPKATVDMLLQHAATDFRPDMRAFTIPTLVVHGAADQIAPIELTGQRTAQAIPGSRLVVYDTGHGLFISERDRLNEDLLAFVCG